MSRKTYFQKAANKYKNGFWINNPTLYHADLAIAAGSISCTTNPTYTSKMLSSKTDRQRSHSLLWDILRYVDDDSKAARLLQRKSIVPLLEKFLPQYKESKGKRGFVSIQGDPLAEDDPDMIINEALEDIRLGQNVIIKIPVTRAGLAAIKYLAAKSIPIIATEIMSLAQVIQVCETYKQATYGKAGRPPLYVTHITGIFDQYIGNRAGELGIAIPENLLNEAGLMIARKQYSLMKERNYHGILLGGGARSLRHFTGLVGGEVDITINWEGTADQLIKLSPPIQDFLHTHVSERDARILMDLLPEYVLAYEPDALRTEDFESYGPVVLFRESFIDGWNDTLAAIKTARSTSRSRGVS